MFRRKIIFLTTLLSLATFSYAAFGECAPKHLKKLKRLHKMAMDDYDQMEFSSARKTLEDAISIARREACDDTLEYANILVDLGIFYITDPDNPDVARGKGRFKKALRINPCAKINDNLKTPRLQKILNGVRKDLGTKCSGGSSSNNTTTTNNTTKPNNTNNNANTDTEDTGPEPSKLEHTPPDEAPQKSPLKIKCRAPKKGVTKLVVYYRKPGQSDYTAIEMNNYSGYSWKAIIPGANVKGAIFQYYIAALGKSGKPIMANGNSGAPNIVSLTKPKKSSGTNTEEDPLDPDGKKKGDDKGKGDEPKDPIGRRWVLKLGGRWGAGYLSTSMCSSLTPPGGAPSPGCDQGVKIANPGFAFGEMGGEIGLHYKISDNFTMGVDAKVGFATTDYAEDGASDKGIGGMGLLKATYYIMGMKEVFRPYVGGLLGGGVTFHEWEVDETQAKRDTFQHGFIMVGASFGFLVGNEKVSFYLNIDAMGIFPEQSTFHIDFTAGLAMGF